MKLLYTHITSILLIFSAVAFNWCTAQKENTTESSVTYLALGDSYTIGESVKKEKQWPRQLRVVLDSAGFTIEEPKIIAKTGWRTDDMLGAAKKEVKEDRFDIVSLLIGVNNEYQGKSPKSFKPEFEECIKYAIDHCNKGREGVFVLSIPDYGYTPFGENNQKRITKRINAYNKLCKEVCEKNDILFINITDISRKVVSNPDLVATDGLHPSGKQYYMWVQEVQEKLIALLFK